MRNHGSHRAGFTLVEIAIVLAIIGVMLSIGVAALTSALKQVNYAMTQDRMDGVAKAIAEYTQKNLFLPCPAPLPTGGAVSTGVARVTCPSPNANKGVLPYRTLGLRDEQARDAYGNYFTYAVNPILATYATVQNAATVSNACRVQNIWVYISNSIPPYPPFNRNPRKARFCCPNNATPANDLRVMSDTVAPAQLSPLRETPAVAAPDVPYDPSSSPPSFRPALTQTAAFVLVSHGRNNYGAYRPGGGGRIPGPSTWSPQETSNANDDDTFVSAPYSGAAVNYFDDIVIWRTQDQLLSALGRDSCARP